MIRLTFKNAFFFVILFGLTSISGSQNLSEIRQDIQRLEKELKAKSSEEQDLLRLVEDLDREIGLRKKLLNRLDKEMLDQTREISRAEQDIAEETRRYEKRKDLIAQRIVALYKRGRVGDLEALLSFNDLNQMLIWMQYQKTIIDQDRRNLEAIKERKEKIEQLKAQLEREIKTKNKLLDETKRETVKIELRKEAQRGPLDRTKKDKASILKQLEDKKRVYALIEKQILEEESKPKTTAQELDGQKFASRKGKLNWPVSGKIINKYGRQKNPVTRTEWENNGIDVEATSGETVFNVADGQVKYIDWQRSMGNLVLVDHGGYYTVYGHIEVMYVGIGQYLTEGEPIGKLGERDSLYGTALHFELWNGKDHVNPELWLRKL